MIRLSPNQYFSTKDYTKLNLLFSNWSWQSPNSKIDLICLGESGAQTVEKIIIKPENVFQTYYLGGEYRNIVIKTSVVYDSSIENWLMVNSRIYPIINIDAGSPSEYEMDLAFKKELPQGLYNAKLQFIVEALNSESKREVLSEYEIPITFKQFPAGISYEPLAVDMYVTDKTEDGYKVNFTADNYEAIIPSQLDVLTSQNVTVRTVNGVTTAQGSGNGSVTIRAKSNVLDSLAEHEDLNSAIEFKTANFTEFVPVKLKKIPGYLLEDTVVETSHKILVVNPIKFPVVKLGNLVVGEVVQLGPVEKWKVSLPIKNIGNVTKLPGVILETPLGDVVEVVYPVKSENFVNFTSPLNKVNFTKTLTDIVFTTSNNNDHFEVDLFVSGNQYLYKVPAFQGKGKINLGDAIHRNIKFNYPENITSFQTFPIPNFDVFVRQYRNGLMIGKKANTINPILKGWNPEQINNIAILSHCKVSRHSKNSFVLINILSLGSYFLYTLKVNGEPVSGFQHVSSPCVATIKINFSGLEVKEGDIVDFVLHVGDDELVKSFVIQPTLDSTILVYEDSFGLRSVLECTGNKVLIENTRNRKYETTYTDKFFHQRKFEVAQENKLTMSTGFLLQSQFIEVEELLSSPVVKLYKDDSTLIDLIPLTDKATVLNKQSFLKSYQLDFHINQKRYAQDYRL